MTTMVHERMIRQSEAFMRRCGYEGILAIEYFVRGGDVIFNEMAPRPHNSGHYTIEGCTTDQYTEWCVTCSANRFASRNSSHRR